MAATENDLTERVTTAGGLTADDVGGMVLGIPDVLGWERHLILRDVEHGTEETYLGFRWNDSPDVSNTERGQFAIGVKVPPSTPVRVAR